MTNAHYFETNIPVDGKRLKEILAIHGVVISEYRPVDPKFAGVVLTPMTIRRAWDHTTGRDHCNGQCRDSRRTHRSWDELDEGQQKEFREHLIWSMNNKWLYDYRPDIALADSPFFPGVALKGCGPTNDDGPDDSAET